MTIKGITRTCFGDVFDSEEALRKMASSYHKVQHETSKICSVFFVTILIYLP